MAEDEHPTTTSLEELTRRLSFLSPTAVADAVEALAGQGVLVKDEDGDGSNAFRLGAAERYVLADRDVVHDPGRSRRRAGTSEPYVPREERRSELEQ